MPTKAHTVEDAAKLLGLSRRKMYELIASRELGSIKIHRSRRITDDQLSDFLKIKQNENAAA